MRKNLGSGGSAAGVEEVLGAEGGAVVGGKCLGTGGAGGLKKVLGEWRKCWGMGGGSGGVEEVLGGWRRC